MLSRTVAAVILSAILSSTASAGHHYHYSYPSWGHYAYAAPVYLPAPVYVAPVHIAPVVVHRPVYVAPVVSYGYSYPAAYPISYSSYGRRHHHHHSWHRHHRGVEVEVEWKRNGYEIEVEYDD